MVLALKASDTARFELLLITPTELDGLGLGKERRESITKSVKEAPAAFSTLVSSQKIVGPDSRYVDFGSARPGTVPAGTDGSTKEVTVCDNATALVQTNQKHEQVFLGTLIQVGEAWKLIDAPSDNQNQNITFVAPNSQAHGNAGGDVRSVGCDAGPDEDPGRSRQEGRSQPG